MTQQRKGRPKWLRMMLWAVGALLLLFIGTGILVGCSAANGSPDVSRLDWESTTVILDRSGNDLYRFHAGENRTPVELDAIPKYVVQAFVAIEDPSFYKHFGINPRGIARAAWRSALYLVGLPGGRLEGGSTITQQLARDAWLSQELSMKRKLQEAWVAFQLERTYTKDEIMELYLNQIYFGRGAYGIEAAAHTFFGKEVGQLTLTEGAQLAGMINGPSYFDPYVHPEDSLYRRNLVLNAMLSEKFIDETAYQAAQAEQPQLGSTEQVKSAANKAGYFTDYVISILQAAKPGLAEKYGLKLGEVDSVAKAGFQVHTTLDSDLQQMAEQAVREQMNQADKEYGLVGQDPLPEAALVVMNPKNGELLAMVGGREHTAMLSFNRATDALRQPGSAIKPLVAYMPALEAGLTPATIFDDAPVSLTQDGKSVWPQNYDFKYSGLNSMRYGVEQSVNPMAVRAMIAAGGPAQSVAYAQKFGLTTIDKEDENPAIALGGVAKGTTVLDMTAAYSAVANLGLKVDPVVITKIVDQRGQTIFAAKSQKQQVVSPSAAYLMVDMMKDVIRRGTAYGFTRGFRGWPTAGKTGTTEDNRDAWFVGFTPDLVVTVWNGYDQPHNHLKWTGAFVPVKIWNQFMTAAVATAPGDWPRPADVVAAKVCRRTGALPDKLCPPDQVRTELFVRGTEPRTASDLLVKVKAVQVSLESPDKKSAYTQWQRWQPGCIGLPEERLFIKFPEPRIAHPTDPYNPKYVPADAKDAVPTVDCQPVSWLERLFPEFPSWPELPWKSGESDKERSKRDKKSSTAPPSSEQTSPQP